jgi:hypothetical protein
MITIEDPKADQIGLVIKELQSIQTFTRAKRDVLERLLELLKISGYKMFNGKAARYGFGPIGASYLYQVPEDKRGHLEPYRGRLVRLVCVGSGIFDRDIMVGEFKN